MKRPTFRIPKHFITWALNALHELCDTRDMLLGNTFN
jgi:hypothetical protein